MVCGQVRGDLIVSERHPARVDQATAADVGRDRATVDVGSVVGIGAFGEPLEAALRTRAGVVVMIGDELVVGERLKGVRTEYRVLEVLRQLPRFERGMNALVRFPECTRDECSCSRRASDSRQLERA